MKKEIKLSESFGKTLEGAIFSRFGSQQCVLMFTDGTFTTLGVQENPEDAPYIIEDKLAVFDFDDRALIENQIVTEEELTNLRNQRSKS